MADELIYIPNDDTLNNPFCKLQLVVGKLGHYTEWTNQSKFKWIRKLYYKTLGTSVIKSPMSPSSLAFYIYLNGTYNSCIYFHGKYFIQLK